MLARIRTLPKPCAPGATETSILISRLEVSVFPDRERVCRHAIRISHREACPVSCPSSTDQLLERWEVSRILDVAQYMPFKAASAAAAVASSDQQDAATNGRTLHSSVFVKG